ncbi:MAG: MerR family transcriptional regulator [Chloroflexi bacterium]|nr:MerR family transcriptional regulator [Chloroflexota bacterium]MDL1882425.1 MerR family transcriptional regulator [Anaerolineae bacterium CFX8]
MFKIGDFSRLTQVPVSALRYYDELGLLKPARIDRFTGYRYYSFDQLPRLNRILALKDLGLSLEQIAQVLDECLTPEQLRGMFRLKQAELQQRVREEQERLARVEARLRQIEMEDKMPDYEVLLKPLPAQRILSLRQIVPTFDHLGTIWNETMQSLQMAGVEMIAPPFCLYYDEAFAAADMDIEFAFPVAAGSPQTIDLSGGRHMTAHDLPAVPQAACAVHKGDYSGLGDVYLAIGRWIEANGYRVVGPPREIYLAGGCAPADAVTEIQFPVEKASA